MSNVNNNKRYFQLVSILQEADPFTKTYVFMDASRKVTCVQIYTLNDDEDTSLLVSSRIGECFTLENVDEKLVINKKASFEEVEAAEGVREQVVGKSELSSTGLPNIKFWYLEEISKGV